MIEQYNWICLTVYCKIFHQASQNILFTILSMQFIIIIIIIIILFLNFSYLFLIYYCCVVIFYIFFSINLLTNLLTYLLTLWSSDLLEKLTGSAASQEIHRIFETRRFLTVLTSARHMSLSWANSIQSP